MLKLALLNATKGNNSPLTITQQSQMARLGTPKAITAMAHKLARIIWHMIKFQQPYDPTVWNRAEEKLKQKRIKRLEQSAAALGYKLLSLP